MYLQICLPPCCFSCDKAKIPLNHDYGGVGVESSRKTLPMLISHSEHNLLFFHSTSAGNNKNDVNKYFSGNWFLGPNMKWLIFFRGGNKTESSACRLVIIRYYIFQFQNQAVELPEMNWHQFPWMKWLWIISFLKIKQRCDWTGDELGKCATFPQTLSHNRCWNYWYESELFKHSCIWALWEKEKTLRISVWTCSTTYFCGSPSFSVSDEVMHNFCSMECPT